MATKIVTKNSSTASAVPTASDLVQGELAVNVADKRLFTEDNAGAIVELGTNPSGNVTFQDNGKAIFGAGSDLQIYHDGSNSYIDEAGQGTLYVRADSATTIANPSNTLSARFRPSTSVSLYYNGVEKLATTSTGIDVTGTATVDGLTVSGNLDVDGGTIKLDGNYPNGVNNVALGNAALLSNTTGTRNTAVGALAGDANTEGNYNSAFGYNSLGANTTGTHNTALGDFSQAANTTGTKNVSVGQGSFITNTTGSNNVVVGTEAMTANTTASNNTAVGFQALYANTTGDRNVSIGTQALAANTTASNNTAVGYHSLLANTTGASNTAMGQTTLTTNTTGIYNSGFGRDSLGLNTTGSHNTAVGESALYANTTADNNTAVGRLALATNTTSSYSTAVGYAAGLAATGDGNTFIGNGAGYQVTTGTRNTFIGVGGTVDWVGGAITTGSKNTIIGGYNGNQGGLDIRTGSNNIVLSDGDGNPRLYIDNIGNLYNPSMPGSTATNSDVRFITSTGQIYYQTSSRRYKENIQDFPSTLDKVNALRPVTFDEIATGEQCYGLIAEEVFEQIPELVNLKEVEGYDEPQPDNIPYSMLSVFLLKAMQEQQTLIDSLTARIEALES